MPRRFALSLIVLLVLLLAALFAARELRTRRVARRRLATPTAVPTPVVPPTPIPPRLVWLFFEAPEDEKLHAEAREVPASTDDVALLRSIAAGVLEGPRHAELLKPFPEGWRLRSAFRLSSRVAVLDLLPPEAAAPAEGMGMGAAPRWNAGSHEEESAAQALLLSVTKNLPGVERVVLLVAGEPADTLGGHLDLTHPLVPDPARAADDAPLPALPPPTPTPTPSRGGEAGAVGTVTPQESPARTPAPAAATPSPGKQGPATPSPTTTRPPSRRTPRLPAAETA